MQKLELEIKLEMTEKLGFPFLPVLATKLNSILA